MHKYKFKSYQQLEHADCGLTCIRMITHYYGKEVSLQTLRKMCDINRLGMSLHDITVCLQALGFETAGVKINVEELRRMPLPAILYWNQNHFVVLYKIARDGQKFYIADPAQGKLTLNRTDFLRHWKADNAFGLASVMEPNDKFKSATFEHEKRNGLMRLICDVSKRYRKNFFLLILLSGLIIAADIYTPLLFQQTIDDGLSKKNIPLVWLLIGGQFLVFLGQYVANCLSQVGMTYVGLKVHINMVNRYLNQLIKFPISFFDRKVNADLIQKLDDLTRIKSFLVNLPNFTFFTFINLLVYSALLVYYNAWVFLLFIIATSFSFAWTKLFMSKRKEIDYSLTHHNAENRNLIYELINGMTEIKVGNAQSYKVEEWNKVQRKINQLSLRSAFVNLYNASGNDFIERLRDLSITGICATLVVQDQMTLGAMMTISYICGRLAVPFNNIVSMAATIQDANISYERLDEILSNQSQQPSTLLPNKNKGIDIQLCSVSFKYAGSTSPYALRDVSIHIPQGKTTALVGESGCGKTTLIKLLLGFYPPTNGAIYINNLSITNINTDDWLSRCGVVMQKGYIFSDSILHNIALSDEAPDLERVREAARMACIDEYFSSLPMGYNTRIGNCGIELSGGQQQRLLIARAIYKRPGFLVLDEATSSLDAHNESEIMHNLTSFNQGRTVVIAAHRLSTIMNADNIVLLDKGKVVEQGTHCELIARKGAYYQLVQKQMRA